jgi:hypothetical protein
MSSASPRSRLTQEVIFYPSWFGGADQADLGVVELAEYSSECLNMEVAHIHVDRSSPDKWIARYEFVAANKGG